MNDSSVRLDVDGQLRRDLLVAHLLRPDSGNTRSDQQTRVFRRWIEIACFRPFPTDSLCEHELAARLVRGVNTELPELQIMVGRRLLQGAHLAKP